MSAQGRLNRFRQTAVVQRVPAGTNDEARTNVIASLKCSNVYDMDEREKERSGMGNVVSACRVYAEYHTTPINNRHRVVIGGRDYRVHKARRWPASNPVYLEIFLEDEGVAAL